jgi:hypothetical protein
MIYRVSTVTLFIVFFVTVFSYARGTSASVPSITGPFTDAILEEEECLKDALEPITIEAKKNDYFTKIVFTWRGIKVLSIIHSINNKDAGLLGAWLDFNGDGVSELTLKESQFGQYPTVCLLLDIAALKQGVKLFKVSPFLKKYHLTD